MLKVEEPPAVRTCPGFECVVPDGIGFVKGKGTEKAMYMSHVGFPTC